MYSNHYSIIKYVSFDMIYYAINPSVVSFFMIFREFVYVFLSMYFYFESIKLNLFSNKVNFKNS